MRQPTHKCTTIDCGELLFEGDGEFCSTHEPGATSVYLCYSDKGTLLYVGVTNCGLRRSEQHAKSKEWWQQVVVQKWEHFATRGEARDREGYLIRAHRPKFNLQIPSALVTSPDAPARSGSAS